jgi:hypothetical protein
LQSGDGAVVCGGREERVDQLSARNVPDLDSTIVFASDDLVEHGGHAAEGSGELGSGDALESCVELIVGRLPDEDLMVASADDPRAKDGEGLDVVFVIHRHLQFSDFLASLENPDATVRVLLLASPCCIYQILVSYACCDEFGSLRAGDEDEVKTAAQIVRLQTAADRGGELKGCLAEGDAGEGNSSRRYETDSLRGTSQQAEQRLTSAKEEVTLYGAKSREEPICL